MNEIQAIRANHISRLREKLRETNQQLNRFYKEYPFCKECGCRAPLGHTEHNYKSIWPEDDDDSLGRLAGEVRLADYSA